MLREGVFRAVAWAQVEAKISFSATALAGKAAEDSFSRNLNLMTKRKGIYHGEIK